MNEKNGRYYVDAFSDYGMDERQRSIQNRLVSRSFKIMYYGVCFLTLFWICFSIVGEKKLPAIYAAMSFYITAGAAYDIYLWGAAKNGIINGITAFGMGGIGKTLILAFYLIVSFFMFRDSSVDISVKISLAVILVYSVINDILENICRRKNEKAMDAAEDDEEEV